MSPAELARGPCRPPETDPLYPWMVTGGKPNGANPGFLIKDAKGDRYLVKFDGIEQGPRATSGDAIVSKMYYAAGFSAPCNQIVMVDRGRLTIAPDAMSEKSNGDEEPLTEKDLDLVFSKAMRFTDGTYRGSASRFITGKPIGPFTYQGTRSDDPNDVIDHEDRRELRGSRLLAAWVQHFDAREQNTLSAWIETGKDQGFVEHYIIDFGDCFGSLWEPPMLGRRIGHSYYFDFEHVFGDFFTVGLVERPWDKAHFGKTGKVLGYYSDDTFDPEHWKPGYPNPAFSRMTELDAAWMARIIARFSDEHLRELVKVGQFPDPIVETELLRVLRGRRDKILERFLTRVSPLAEPAFERGDLCLRNVALHAGVDLPNRYVAQAFRGIGDDAAEPVAVSRIEGTRVCVTVPKPEADSDAPQYFIVDIGIPGLRIGPARVHYYRLKDGRHQIVALERPQTIDPPG